MNPRMRLTACFFAASLGLTAAAANATIIDFDAGLDGTLAPFAPLLTNGDALSQNGFYIGTASTKATALPGDFVGALVDGNDNGTCFNVTCPSNNHTNYLAMLDDGLPYLYAMNGSTFTISSFDAGFIAAAGATVPGVPLLLRVYGFIGATSYFEDVLLNGLVGSELQFATYTLSSTFAARSYEEVDFYGYACDATGSCNRATNAAQFALDNINLNTIAVTPVPEPETFALMGAGLIALSLFRRRSAKA